MKMQILKSVNYFFIVCILTVFFVIHPVCGKINELSFIPIDQNSGNNSLTLAERDVLSFSLKPSTGNDPANLTPLLYHESWVMNNYDQAKTVTIINHVKKEKFNPSTGYPLFGKKYLLQQSLIPDYLTPNNVHVLENPIFTEENDSVNFFWNNVTIGPHDAVIIAYANEYENETDIYSPDGFILPDLNLTSSYTDKDPVLYLNYTMTNTGKNEVHSPKFIVFFPEKINNTEIFQPSDITITSNCQMDIFENTSYNDGTGHFSVGHMMLSHCPEYLNTTQSNNFNIKIQGNGYHFGKLFPSLIIDYLEDGNLFNKNADETILSPPDTLVSDDSLNLTRYYYYDVSIVLPEHNYFTIPQGNYILPSLNFFIFHG